MLAGLIHFGLLGALFLIIPKFWRPEVPFGISLTFEGSEDVRTRALRYWRASVVLLTLAAFAIAFLIANLRPRVWFLVALYPLYFIAGMFVYARARRMLLPLARPSSKVGAALRRRRYRDYMSPWSEIIPLALVAIGLALVVWTYFSCPQEGGRYYHWTSASGLWYPRRPHLFWQSIFPGVFVYPVILLQAVLMAHSKQSVGRGDPEVSLAANDAFRKAWLRVFYWFRIIIAVTFVASAAGIAMGNNGITAPMRAVPFVLLGCFALFVILVWATAFLYGQGGWRWAVRKGLVDQVGAAAILDGDGMPDRSWKLGMFYFNPSDPSILVERRFGFGWTLNYGSIWAVAFMVTAIGLALLPYLLSLLTLR